MNQLTRYAAYAAIGAFLIQALGIQISLEFLLVTMLVIVSLEALTVLYERRIEADNQQLSNLQNLQNDVIQLISDLRIFDSIHQTQLSRELLLDAELLKIDIESMLKVWPYPFPIQNLSSLQTDFFHISHQSSVLRLGRRLRDTTAGVQVSSEGYLVTSSILSRRERYLEPEELVNNDLSLADTEDTNDDLYDDQQNTGKQGKS